MDELLADDRVQIVVSCTHPDVRREHCVRAAEAGRHIVIEKPIGLNAEDTLAIRDAVTKAGVKTVTSVVLRWNPQFLTVRQLIEDGVLGELVYGEADYWHPLKTAYPGYRAFVSRAQGGSAFVTGGCQAVDILRYLGGEVVEGIDPHGPCAASGERGVARPDRVAYGCVERDVLVRHGGGGGGPGAVVGGAWAGGGQMVGWHGDGGGGAGGGGGRTRRAEGARRRLGGAPGKAP